MFDAGTERAIAEERDRMADLLCRLRVLGAFLWVVSVVAASILAAAPERTRTEEFQKYAWEPTLYLVAAVVLFLVARSGKFRPLIVWAVPIAIS